MWVYAWLLLLPLILAIGRHWRRLEGASLILAWAALTLFIGFRRFVGTDWDAYQIMFVRTGTYPVLEAITLSDPGYMLLSSAVANLGFSIAILNAVCAAVFAAGLLIFVRRQPSPPLAMLIAIPVLILIASLTTRQSVALGLEMAALAFYVAGARRLPSLLLVVALLFHWSAILLVPLVPIMAMRRIRPRWIILAGASAGLALAAALLSIPALADRIALLPQSGGALYRAVPTALAIITLLVLWRRLDLDEREERIAAYLAALGLFAVLITPVFAMAGDRFGLYAIPLQMMVLTRAAVLAPPGTRRLAVQSAIAAPFLLLFAAWLTLTSYGSCLSPYRSYLLDPSALRDADQLAHLRPYACMQGG